MRKLLGSLLAVCLLAGVVSASDKKQSAPLTDNEIYGLVREKLTVYTTMKGGDLVGQVVDGVVTPSGPVDTPKAKTKAGTIAKKVAGVKSDVNNITVQP